MSDGQEPTMLGTPSPDSSNSAPPADERLRRLGCEIYDSTLLSRVTHVMDMDGFFIGRCFYPKEVCLLELERDIAWRADVLLPMSFRALTMEQRTSVTRVTHRVHGMYWENGVARNKRDVRRSVLRDAATMEQTVSLALADWSDRVGRAPLVAYKSGHIERDLLQRIGIQSLDLYYYGCPKFDYLVANCPEAYGSLARTSAPISRSYLPADTDFLCDLHRSPGAGNSGASVADPTQHRRLRPTTWHCPVYECRVFARWLQLALCDCRYNDIVHPNVPALGDDSLAIVDSDDESGCESIGADAVKERGDVGRECCSSSLDSGCSEDAIDDFAWDDSSYA